jgi:hypothetical protein
VVIIRQALFQGKQFLVLSYRSIAFGIPTGAVDGNVCRVFSRLFLISTDLTKKEGKSLIWWVLILIPSYDRSLANELVDPGQPGHFNQAVMVSCLTRASDNRKLGQLYALHKIQIVRHVRYQGTVAPLRKPSSLAKESQCNMISRIQMVGSKRSTANIRDMRIMSVFRNNANGAK